MNKLYKTLIYQNQVSLSVMETTDMVQDAIRIHNLGDKEAELLGGLLTAATYIAGCLKSPKGAISITVKSQDGSATASVSGDVKGHIRGYAEGAQNGLKGGVMTVVKEDGFFRPFVGVSALKSQDVSQNLMEYFHVSEQIPTAVAIGVSVKGGVCECAGGVVMQLLPGTSQANMDKAENRMQSFVNIIQVLKTHGAEGIMKEYFAEDTLKGGVYLTFPQYKCNCSREKIANNVLSALGKEELYSILAEQGKISVHCHYCNKDHVFLREDVDKLF